MAESHSGTQSWHQRFWRVELMLGLFAAVGILLILASGEQVWGRDEQITYPKIPNYLTHGGVNGGISAANMLLWSLGLGLLSIAFIFFLFLHMHWHYSQLKEA